jgi:hypothetical protein
MKLFAIYSIAVAARMEKVWKGLSLPPKKEAKSPTNKYWEKRRDISVIKARIEWYH